MLNRALKVRRMSPCSGISSASPIRPAGKTPRPSRRSKNRWRSTRISREAHNLFGAALAARGDSTRRTGAAARAANQPRLSRCPGQSRPSARRARQSARRGLLLRSSRQLKPNDAEIRTNYAVTLAALNRFEAAQRQIDAAVKADPKSAEAHNFRGILLEHAGNAAAALAEFLEATELQPGFGQRAFERRKRILAARRRRPPPLSNSCAKPPPATTQAFSGRLPPR